MLPTSLEVIDISGGNYYNLYSGLREHHNFTGGIPPEWGALTNLKELKMAYCELDGAFGSTRIERLRILLTFFDFVFQEHYPRSSGSSSI